MGIGFFFWIRQGAYTGVCSQQHVPSYKNNLDKFKAKGIDSVICVAVNDPFVLNAWADKLEAKDSVSDYLTAVPFLLISRYVINLQSHASLVLNFNYRMSLYSLFI